MGALALSCSSHSGCSFGGLFTSTALTLLVLPAFYSLFGKYLIPKKEEMLAERDGKLNEVSA